MNAQPRNAEEWTDALAAVHVARALSLGAAYGVINSAGHIDLRRCHELEVAARAHGVPPAAPPPVVIHVVNVVNEGPPE